MRDLKDTLASVGLAAFLAIFFFTVVALLSAAAKALLLGLL